MRIRDLGYLPGSLGPGRLNSITDVPGVSVGTVSVHSNPDIHTGVTVILPRPASEILNPCYAGVHVLNGAGELTGSHQIREWGFTNTPLAFTSSVSLGKVYSAIWKWMFQQHGKFGRELGEQIKNYGAPVVGETADWFLNDISRDAVEEGHVMEAFARAEDVGVGKIVEEGSTGGGTGMQCYQFKGGTGTASRLVRKGDAEGTDGGLGEESYVVGVLVQTNFGLMKDLTIGGVPVGKLLMKEDEQQKAAASSGNSNLPSGKQATLEMPKSDGSVLVLINTDAPLLPHQLTRLAQRATVGVCATNTHGVGLNSSGDIFLALSTANIPEPNLKGLQRKWDSPVQSQLIEASRDFSMNVLFYAAAEATEEAILNSMVGAREGMTGYSGNRSDGLQIERVERILKKHLVNEEEYEA